MSKRHECLKESWLIGLDDMQSIKESCFHITFLFIFCIFSWMSSLLSVTNFSPTLILYQCLSLTKLVTCISWNCLNYEQLWNYLHPINLKYLNRYGSWGVCFTYGGWFGIKGLVAAGRTYKNCSSIRKACNYLLSK